MVPNRERLKKLCLAHGPVGCEASVADLIAQYAAPLCGEMYTDRLSNVVCRVRGREPDKPPLAVFAHTGEAGIMITAVEEDGSLRFGTVGEIDACLLISRTVSLQTRHGFITGVVGAKPVHLLKADERKTVPSVRDLYIEIGTNTKEQTLALVAPGDTGTLHSAFLPFGDGMVSCKALDDRAGCEAMLTVMEHLKENIPERDVIFAFTSGGCGGICGASAVAHATHVSYALVLDTVAVSDCTDGEDAPARTGGGVVLQAADKQTLYDRQMLSYCTQTARKYGIAWQYKQSADGVTDAGAVHLTDGGIRTAAFCVPCRYSGSANSVIALSDLQAMCELTAYAICDFSACISDS